MSDNDISQIKDRLTKIEVQVAERGLAHDKRAAERWTDLMDKFHEMTKKLDNRPCADHIKLMTEMNGRIKATELAAQEANSEIDKAKKDIKSSGEAIIVLEGRVDSLGNWVDKAGWAIGVIYAALVVAVITMVFKHL